LTIRVAPEAAGTQGLAIKRDGMLQAPASWGVPMPVDPGEHVVEASAPGRKSLRIAIKVGVDADGKQALVPMLEAQSEAPGIAAQPTAEPVAPVHPEAPPGDKTGSSGLRTAGWVVGGLGILGLGIGTGFALHASSRNSDSKADCAGDFCGPQGFSDRTDAVAAGNRATVGFAIGGIFVAGGLTMILLGGSGKQGASMQASPAVGWNSVGIVMKGRL
jgi:hypothetical protein